MAKETTMPSFSRFRRATLALTAAAIVVAASVPAEAQYFGRNKVRYRTFKYQVLKTAHFDIYYYPEERLAVEQAAQMAERWYARLSKILNHELRTRQPVILYASHPDFEQTNVLEGEMGEGTGGVTEILKRRVVLPMAGPLAVRGGGGGGPRRGTDAARRHPRERHGPRGERGPRRRRQEARGGLARGVEGGLRAAGRLQAGAVPIRARGDHRQERRRAQRRPLPEPGRKAHGLPVL